MGPVLRNHCVDIFWNKTIQISEYLKHSEFEFSRFYYTRIFFLQDPDVNFISCDFDYDRNQIYLYDKNYRRLVVGSNFNTSLTKDIVWTEEQNSMSPDDVKVSIF